MRIDAFNSSSDIAQGMQKVSSDTPAGKALSAPEDRATLSSESVSLSSLTAKALENPGVRQDRIDALRLAVSSGNYRIDAFAIASAMVDDNA